MRVLLIAVFLVCGVISSPRTAGGAGEEIKLPLPKHTGTMSVEQAIYQRRSIRSYSDESLSLDQISQVLWSAGGKTVDGITGPTRAYASAGGRYPLEIYLVAGKVTSLGGGIYRYNWANNSLRLLKKGDFRKALANAAYGQRMIAEAPATIVITAVHGKAMSRYGRRGAEQYVYMDAGHLGQNVHLQAESLGLGTVMVGAYSDSEVIRIMGVRGEKTVYIMPVGKPRK